MVKYWLDFSAHIQGTAWYCPALPRSPARHSPTGLSILHECELTQPFISRWLYSPSLTTPSASHTHRAAPLLKFSKATCYTFLFSAMLPALLCCFDLSVCTALSDYMHERCIADMNGFENVSVEATSVISGEKEVRDSYLSLCQKRTCVHWQRNPLKCDHDLYQYIKDMVVSTKEIIIGSSDIERLKSIC